MTEARCRHCGEATSRSSDHVCCEDCEYVVHKVPEHKRRYGRRAPLPPPIIAPYEPCPLMGLDEVIAANERADARYRRVVLTWIFLLTAVVAVAAAFGWKQ